MKMLMLSAVPLTGVLLLACSGSAAQERSVVVQNRQQEGIVVSGHGETSGRPDVALLVLGVSAERQTVKQARDDAATAMEAVIGAVKRRGVADKDVQTTQFRIEPQFDYRGGTSMLRAYRVTNLLTVKVRDLDKTDDIVDSVVEAGGDLAQVQSLSFAIDDPAQVQAEARTRAMADAKAKAAALADAAGVSVGRPISISETADGPRPLIGAPAMAAVAAESTPIEAGELDVTVDVTVVYEVG